MQAGEGLFLAKCSSIHTVGMKFPIDVLFVAWDGRVRRVARSLMPGAKKTASSIIQLDSDCVLELPSGGALSTEVGDQITFTRL
jgi:uncharacterized membrane protein (UPF0127 family)